jgi:2-C-methyl-D-erythritol 4-phosphate cytidylyltransferase
MTDAVHWCVIPAAGSGSRMGGAVPKQYLPVLGRALLERTMDRLCSHPRVAGLMVVLAPDDTRWPGIDACAEKPVRTAVGGAERAHSVRAGLEALMEFVAPDECVLVHDAARPAVTHDELDRLIDAGSRHPVGAILAVPITDTVKRARSDRVIDATLERERLWRALTPQMFRLEELLVALAARPDAAPSDDAQALEAMGRFPLLVEGSAANIKVTRAEDLPLVEAILRAQGER